MIGDDLGEVSEELTAGQWVKARDRLVEDQQLRAFRDRECEGELCPLTA
jgi:hypothetical protein